MFKLQDKYGKELMWVIRILFVVNMVSQLGYLALLQISWCCGLLSVVCPSTYHIFDISGIVVGLSWNLVGGIGATWRIRIAKIVAFWYPSRGGHLENFQRTSAPETWWRHWRPEDSELPKFSFLRPSWNFSSKIPSQSASLSELKLDGRHRSNIDIQNC